MIQRVALKLIATHDPQNFYHLIPSLPQLGALVDSEKKSYREPHVERFSACAGK